MAKKECPVCKGTEFYPSYVQWGIATPEGFLAAKLVVCANPKCNVVLAIIDGQPATAVTTIGRVSGVVINAGGEAAGEKKDGE